MKIMSPRVCLLALSVIAVFTSASCAKSREVKSAEVKSTAGASVSYPDPNPTWQGKAAGEVRPFGPVGEDLKAYLLGYPAPEVWLAFPPSAGQAPAQNTASGGDEPTTIRVNLPPEAVARLAAYWRETLAFRYELDVKGAPDRQSHYELLVNMTNANTRAGNELMEMQIDAPDGRRTICPAEAWDIMKFINLAAAAIIEQAKEYKKAERT